MNISQLLGRRVLLKIGGAWGRQEVTEYKVLEVSPSGSWVKLQNMNGNKFWKPLHDVAFVEALQELTKDKPQDPTPW